MSKVYCRDCTNYCSGIDVGSVEHCIIVTDDYLCQEHEIRTSPQVRNHSNDCPFFETKKSKPIIMA